MVRGHSGNFDADEETRERSHWRTLASLVPYLWPQGRYDLRLRVLLAMALLAAAKVSIVTIPFFYKGAVDALNADPGAGLLVLPVGFILAYGGARILTSAFGELRDAVFAKVGQHALRTVALSVFRHLHALSLAFHVDRRTGGLSRAIERGTKGIDFLLRFSLFNIIPTLLEIFLVCGVLWYTFGWIFPLLTFVSVAAYIVFTLVVTEWRIKYRREMNRTDSEANTRAIDSLLNFETVKYFGNEGHEAARFDQAMALYEKAAVKSLTSLAMLNIGQGFIVAFGMCSVMYLAAVGIRDGSMTLGDFVLVNTFMMQLYQPLGFLGMVYREIKQSLVDMEKMFELLSVGNDVDDREGAQPIAIGDGDVVFENVDFAYRSDRPILHDVSFRVPAGKTVAIVGPSGAGKSTISRILFRFYDVGGGRVLIDGQDIREVTQTSLRAEIGIVPQDTVLFNDSIGYNIRYGNPGASDSEVEEAAKLSQIHDFVSALPEGYQSPVGERGLKLSGGEKQRVAIARAILKNPRVFLFDEATSALDTRTERMIQENLREVSRGTTTVIIAHRLSTVVHADQILVLDEGKVVEHGTHDALLRDGGRYAALWARQQQRIELDAAD